MHESTYLLRLLMERWLKALLGFQALPRYLPSTVLGLPYLRIP